jgi:DNA-binding beta-propeller fold protein YncE
VFGPDGNLYVSSSSYPDYAVLRYDGTTGAFIDVFASGGGLDHPRGLVFGPDGNLYVVSYNNHGVLRYDGQLGNFLDAFVPSRSGGLFTPNDLTFGPDSNLYVTGGTFMDGLGVFRYDGQTGQFLDLFASTDGLGSPGRISKMRLSSCIASL